MKKRFIMIALFLCFITTNVYAEPTTWPNTFTYGDYEYQIEGVSIRVYQLEKENDKDETTDESFNNYINEVVTREIPLPSTSYTINPEYRLEKLNGIDTILVDLNLNITKEQLETFLSDEIAATTVNKNYIAELVLNYKLINYPSTYQHIYNINFVRELIKLFSNQPIPEQDMTQSIHQVFNAATITYSEEDNSAVLNYQNVITEDNHNADYVLNYLGFYENSYLEDNNNPSKILMFYNIDNIDYLLDNINQIEDSIENNLEIDKNPKTSISEEVIKTPNTVQKAPKYLYEISIFCVVVGLGLMGYTIYKDKKKNS